jgi:hypothetical protein
VGMAAARPYCVWAWLPPARTVGMAAAPQRSRETRGGERVRLDSAGRACALLCHVLAVLAVLLSVRKALAQPCKLLSCSWKCIRSMCVGATGRVVGFSAHVCGRLLARTAARDWTWLLLQTASRISALFGLCHAYIYARVGPLLRIAPLKHHNVGCVSGARSPPDRKYKCTQLSKQHSTRISYSQHGRQYLNRCVEWLTPPLANTNDQINGHVTVIEVHHAQIAARSSLRPARSNVPRVRSCALTHHEPSTSPPEPVPTPNDTNFALFVGSHAKLDRPSSTHACTIRPSLHIPAHLFRHTAVGRLLERPRVGLARSSSVRGSKGLLRRRERRCEVWRRRMSLTRVPRA